MSKANAEPSKPNGAADEPLLATEAGPEPPAEPADTTASPSPEDEACVATMSEADLEKWTHAQRHAAGVGQEHSRVARQLLRASRELEQAKDNVAKLTEANARAAEAADQAEAAFQETTTRIFKAYGVKSDKGSQYTITDDGRIFDQRVLARAQMRKAME